MASVFFLLYAVIAIVSTVSGQEEGTCRACNCQLNNVEVINQLIESKIASGKLATTCTMYVLSDRQVSAYCIVENFQGIQFLQFSWLQ